jgi:fibronectin type 3 domain-containing protein
MLNINSRNFIVENCMKSHRHHILALWVSLGLAAMGAQAAPLPAYNVDIKQSGVSGLSSGAFMAAQVGVGFSSYVKYVGVVAGGSTWCSKGQLGNALGMCMSATTAGMAPRPADYVSWINARSADGSIDHKSNLATQRWWLFSGAADTTVYPFVGDANQSVMNAFLNPGNLIYVSRRAGTAHTMPTLNYGGACGTTATPWVGNCAYDAAGAMFAHMFGPLKPRNGGTLSGSFIEFNQTEFIAPGHGVANTGHAYIPAACASGALCKAHVALHGCKQMDAGVGDAFYKHAGYNQWADTNNIIMIYPQTMKSSNGNPNGCWDWWAYDDSNFALKSGRQMAFIDKIFKRVASGFVALPAPTGLAVTGNSNNSVSLSWNVVSGASGYNILRNGNKINPSLIAGTSYTDSNGLSQGSSYSYSVNAQNAAGQQSVPGASIVGSTSGTPPPLAAPFEVVAITPTATTITLNWNAAQGANLRGYNVYRATKSGGPYTKANASELAATDLSYVATGLNNSTKYYFVVRAVNTSGVETANSSQVSNSTSTGFPCTEATACVWDHFSAGRAVFSPNFLSYLAKGSNQDLGLTGFCGGAFGANAPITLKNSAPNFYEKGLCAPGGAETGIPTVPTNLSVASVTDSSAKLVWTASSGSALAGYNIYRSTSNSGNDYTKINSSPVNMAAYSDSGLASASTYYYVVRAVDQTAQETANSNQVSATTLAMGTVQSMDIRANDTAASHAPSGYVKATCLSGASPEVGTLGNLAMGRGFDGKCNRTILSFDTSAIPDGATITRAWLKVNYSSSSGNPWASPPDNSLVIDVKTGVYAATMGTEPGDWSAAPTASAVASIAKFSSGSAQSSNFDELGLAAIDKTALTQLKLRFAADQGSSGYLFITKNATLHIEYK